MYYLAEDPTYLAGALGVVGLGGLIALKLTQQGKYLMWALAAFGLAVAVVGVEWLWVTDEERVEAVVLDLARAVRRSDAEGVIAHLAPEVSLSEGDRSVTEATLRGLVRRVPGVEQAEGAGTRAMIRYYVGNARFDFLTVSRLETNVGANSRRGTAAFRVMFSGTMHTESATSNFGATGSDWSLGLREVDGQWKVNRITAVRLPPGFHLTPVRAPQQ